MRRCLLRCLIVALTSFGHETIVAVDGWVLQLSPGENERETVREGFLRC